MKYVQLLRPSHWIKNLFILVPIFFARGLFNHQKALFVLISTIAFCFSASCVYIFNDIFDRHQDSKHSHKNARPIASGQISVRQGWIILVTLFVSVCAMVYLFVPQVALLFGLYFVANLLYTLYLKRIAVIDILIVSAMYLIRIGIGGQAASVPVSHWLVLCTIFFSLFLIIAKRKAELSQDHPREVLKLYTPELLNIFLTVSVALTLVAYSLYTVLAVTSALAVYSIFFVILAFFRYLVLVYTTDKAEYPERAIWIDPVILIAGFAWMCFMYGIFYLK